jgi:hypothetical protein
MKILLIVFTTILLSIGCQSGNKEAAKDTVNESLPEDFKHFYTKFHQDSQFQLDHILFPFKSRKYETKDAFITLEWNAETWKIHHPFGASEEGFTREFTIADEKYITEIIYLKAGGFGLERRFAFIDTAWYLVMYNEYIQPNNGEQ